MEVLTTVQSDNKTFAPAFNPGPQISDDLSVINVDAGPMDDKNDVEEVPRPSGLRQSQRQTTVAPPT